MPVVYLGIGSNLGLRQDNLSKAISMIQHFSSIISISSVYQSKPWGYKAQSCFLNLACCIETDLNPIGLLRVVKDVEIYIGRTPMFKNGPRIIDIDILLYDEKVINLPDLCVPHRGIPERSFVLLPLNEIAPDLIHPYLGKRISELAEQLKDKNLHMGTRLAHF